MVVNYYYISRWAHTNVKLHFSPLKLSLTLFQAKHHQLSATGPKKLSSLGAMLKY